MASTKPILLVGCTPVIGHLSPILNIVRNLVGRGYEVHFVMATDFRKEVEDTGAIFHPFAGFCNFTLDGVSIEKRFPERKEIPAGPVRMAFDIGLLMMNPLPSQFWSLQLALDQITKKNPGRDIIGLTEGAFYGSVPSMLEAAGIRPKAWVGIGVIPMLLSSCDHPPFGPGLPPDSSPEGRERNKAMTKEVQWGILGEQNKKFHEILSMLKAKEITDPITDSIYKHSDRFLQMCIPSVEYPRSDAPSTIRFAGGIPKSPFGSAPNFSWWDKVTQNPSGRRIIFASQGTAAINYNDLLVPAIKAFKNRDDVMLIVALGIRGAVLPNTENAIPGTNTFVEEFIPYDQILPYCDVFVTNGGYGGFQHAIKNGVPLVMGGTTEDKPEVNARAEWAGVSINLKTDNPSVEQIEKAVDEILQNSKYKQRMGELKTEFESYDGIGIIEETILELAAK
ncbi:hypothetical protein B7463_g7329, partial [Scytalidium lignicola]